MFPCVGFRGFVALFLGLFMMPASRLRMMGRLLVVAGVMVFGGGAVVFGCLGMMFRSFPVMLCSFFRHRNSLGELRIALPGESSEHPGDHSRACRAEVLMTPGVFLGVWENSSFKVLPTGCLIRRLKCFRAPRS